MDSEEMAAHAVAALTCDEITDFAVMFVYEDGQFGWLERQSRAEARRTIARSVDQWRSFIWDGKREGWRSPLSKDQPGRRKRRPPIPASVRFDVLVRDGHRCVYCGRTAAEVPLHVDHKIAWSKGGPDDPSNLVTACRDCNLGKGAR